MLYLAREDEPDRHRGAVVRLQDSVFAPPEEVLHLVRLDAPDIDVDAFRGAYLRYLRARWRHDPEAFLRLIERATGGADLTVTDDFGDAPHAPRRILGRPQADCQDPARRGATPGAGARGGWPCLIARGGTMPAVPPTGPSPFPIADAAETYLRRRRRLLDCLEQVERERRLAAAWETNARLPEDLQPPRDRPRLRRAALDELQRLLAEELARLDGACPSDR